jgi:hypothetical protein
VLSTAHFSVVPAARAGSKATEGNSVTVQTGQRYVWLVVILLLLVSCCRHKEGMGGLK